MSEESPKIQLKGEVKLEDDTVIEFDELSKIEFKGLGIGKKENDYSK